MIDNGITLIIMYAFPTPFQDINMFINGHLAQHQEI